MDKIEEISWPACIFLFLIVAISQVTSCQESSDIEKTKRDVEYTKLVAEYTKAGCKKVAIFGSSGTHWVCNDNK